MRGSNFGDRPLNIQTKNLTQLKEESKTEQMKLKVKKKRTKKKVGGG